MIEQSIARYNYADQLPGIDEEIIPKLRDSLLNGRYVLTSEVNKFEEGFAEYCGSKYGVGVNSGLDALTLAYTALSLGTGDEIITVANTFHATVLAIVRVGAIPVLVDCDPDSYLMDIEQLRAAITPRTKAITVVHLFGKAQDMTDILKIAIEHDLYIVEDACQSIGAKWQGQRVGSIGTLGCFSFHPSKNLAAAGDAGIIVTNDAELKDRLIQLRYFGQEAPNHHSVIGWNTKLDTFQAIVLNSKLPLLDRWNDLRFEKAQYYREKLFGLPINFQSTGEIGSHVYHLFQIKVSSRDKLFEYLCKRGIDVTIRYSIPIHLQPAFANLGYKLGHFPISEILSDRTLCLPIRPDLTNEEIDYICETISNFFSEAKVAHQSTTIAHKK